jgi:hypothetical protein
MEKTVKVLFFPSSFRLFTAAYFFVNDFSKLLKIESSRIWIRHCAIVPDPDPLFCTDPDRTKLFWIRNTKLNVAFYKILELTI